MGETGQLLNQIFRTNDNGEEDEENDDYNSQRRNKNKYDREDIFFTKKDSRPFENRRKKHSSRLRDDILWGSDIEDEEDDGEKGKKNVVESKIVPKRCSKYLNRDGTPRGIVMCIDVNYTIVDAKNNPYPSVRSFYDSIKNGLSPYDVFIVIYTHANDEYIVSLLEKRMTYFKPDLIITRDNLTSNNFQPSYDKPVTLLRRLLPSSKYLSYATVIIDDLDANLDESQYDIVCSIRNYYKWKSGINTGNVNDAIDADYASLLKYVEKQVNFFYRIKN